jgi:hypothetical protein
MPRGSVWLIRMALLNLVAAATLGGWLLVAKGEVVPAPPGGRETHAAIALLGWLVQMTAGVAYWILPRHPTEPAHGAPWAPWVALVGLNGGIAAIALADRVRAGSAIGPGLAGLGMVAFVAAIGPRIKAFGVDR